MPWLLSPTNAIDNLKIGLYGEPEQSICTWSDIAGSNSDRHAPDRSIRQEAELEHLPLADTKVVTRFTANVCRRSCPLNKILRFANITCEG
jgi:hypothetical protein